MEELSTNNEIKTLERPSRVPTYTLVDKNAKESFSSARLNEKEGEFIPDTTEMPPSLLKEAGKDPYLNTLLEVGDAYNHFNMKSLIDSIDEYILSETDSREGYKKLFEEILEKANPKRDNIYDLVGGIEKYVRLLIKIKEAEKLKAEIDAKPIDELSADQLKERILNG